MHLLWDKLTEKGKLKLKSICSCVVFSINIHNKHIFLFCSGSESLEDEGERSKSKANIMESLSEDGNYVANISNMVAGRVGNIFGKGIGGLSTKFGGGSSSWF